MARILLTLICTLILSANLCAAAEADRVLLRFATFGDSRHDPDAPGITAQDKIWIQNTKVLARISREIQDRKSQLLFFNGDMINGYTADRAVLDPQYAYWRGMMAHLFENGIYVVPVPGNHEVQVRSKNEKGVTVKLAAKGNEELWRSNMGDIIIDTLRWSEILGGMIENWSLDNAPHIGGDDGTISDQRQLSYSFDFKGNHFAIINTDAAGNDGKAPLKWLSRDLAAAAKRGAERFFIFGHRPAFTYRFARNAETAGLDLFPQEQKRFWDLVEQYGALYFCGHEHIYNVMQPRKGEGGKSWQILVGSGGSPFDAPKSGSAAPTDRLHAWAEVTVFASGRVKVEAYGFDEKFGATRALDSFWVEKK